MVYVLKELTAGNAGNRGGTENTETPRSLVLLFVTDAYMFWFSVPCIRSHKSAGQFVVHFVMGLIVGDRRFPGAILLGKRFSTSSANQPVSVPPTGSEPRDGFSYGFVLGLRFPLPEAVARRRF